MIGAMNNMIKERNTVKLIYKGEEETDEITKNKIQEYWQKMLKEKEFLHENQILIVSSLANNKNDYTIELKKSTFSKFMYSKENKAGDMRALFSGAYILTADHYIVCVLNHYYENEVEFETLNLVGGMADVADIIEGEYSCEKCLIREVKEELGFDLEDANWNIQLKYLKYPSKNENSSCYPIGTLYEIKTSYTKEQLEKMFIESTHDNEVKELLFFSKENYKKIYEYEHKKQYIPELFEMVFKKECLIKV